MEYCRNKTPKNEMVYTYFAFSVMMTIITTFSLDKSIYNQHIILVNVCGSACSGSNCLALPNGGGSWCAVCSDSNSIPIGAGISATDGACTSY